MAETPTIDAPTKEPLDIGMKLEILSGAAISKGFPNPVAQLVFVSMVEGSMRYTNMGGETFLRYKLGARRLVGAITGRTDHAPGEIGEIIDPPMEALESGGWIEMMRPGRRAQQNRPGEFAAWRLHLKPRTTS